MCAYYDGTKLLSLTDLDGKQPEILMVTTNRTGGKTTYFGRLCVNKFKKGQGKFALLYRYNYELDDCADKFFKDLSTLFFSGSVMESKRKASGIFHELFLDGESCGYALSLNSADQLKKYSHLFSDVNRMIFDEFQSESNHYCSDEIKKFISIHTSVARGQGEQVRYVPVYMLSNPVSLINPYYVELGISNRLRDDTKFLRGHGFILEQGFIDSASVAQKESGFNKAFAKNSYVAYSSECVYLNDNKAFIEKPNGIGRYLCTIKYNGTDFGVREFADSGFIYVDDRPDTSYKYKITVTTSDHEINYVMLKRNDMFLTNLRFYFEKGCFRFKDLRCKEAILKALSY
nr:MAG TPA_asm: Terminase [Caudoviricetes sp.]